jgi:V-type H+-transporting ATPase subunit a
MGIFRSEDMFFYQFTCLKDNAWKVIHELGDLNGVDFIDLNSGEQTFNLPYGQTIKRCEEVLRNLTMLEEECGNWEISLKAPKTTASMGEAIKLLEHEMKKTSSSFFDQIESDTKNIMDWTNDSQRNYKECQKGLLSLLMYKEVLKMSLSRYRQSIEIEQNITRKATTMQDSIREPLLESVDNSDFVAVSTSNISGVIDKFDVERLRRLVFRATRGKAICLTEDIDPEILKEENIKIPKTIYLIIFQSGDFLDHKINTICDSFMGEKFDLPRMDKCSEEINDITIKIKHAKETVSKITKEMRNYFISLNIIKGCNHDKFKVYEMYVSKEIIIYSNLNKLIPENTLIHGLFWSNLPNRRLQTSFQEIQQRNRFPGLQAFDITGKKLLTPPTYIRSNDFLEPFQLIVNTYGIPNYKEVNPAYFTIITFPFLFGVMFGDIAHGLLLFLFATYLCQFNEGIKKSGSMLSALLPARHLFLMMGMFATFCGLCYNDFMSIPLEIFGDSCFPENSDRPIEGCIYPIGIDPRWYRSSSAITYVNSVKMKISVIIAVSQMSLGVIMEAFNAIHFNSHIDLIFEFIPRIILLLGLFGYMDLLIIIKWMTDYTGIESQAPSIISTMINIPLKGAAIEGQAFISDMATNQTLSLTLLLIAVIMVPIMLLPKPFILISRIHAKHQEEIRMLPHNEPNEKIVEEEDSLVYEKLDGEGDDEERLKYEKLDAGPEDNKDDKDGKDDKDDKDNKKVKSNFVRLGKVTEDNKAENLKIQNDDTVRHEENKVGGNNSDSSVEIEFYKKRDQLTSDSGENHSESEIFIHQLIETIEFVLGTISNTASYLRLWALSLAHSQLAEVFFSLTLWSGVQAQSPIMIFIGFAVFASASFSVLM